jgi:hypothetical protein
MAPPARRTIVAGALLTAPPLLVAAVVAARTAGAPILTGDSSGYMAFHPTRPVGYPAFLWLISKITPDYAALAPAQWAILALSIAALGLAFWRAGGGFCIALAVEAAAVANPAYWANGAAIMSEALSAATLNLFGAVLLLHVRASRPWMPLAYACLCLVGVTLRPVNIAMGPAAIFALALLTEGGWERRLRTAALPVLIVAGGVVAGYLATPLAQRAVHHEAAAANPLARGLLQKVLFHDGVRAPVPGVDAADQAIIEQPARAVRAYLAQAPADIRPALERTYSDYLRFEVILPALAERHHVDAEWRIDPVLYRYATARIGQHPMDFLADVLTEDLRLLSYQGFYDRAFAVRQSAFLRAHPPVVLALPPPLQEGIDLDSRALQALRRAADRPAAYDLAAHLRPQPPRSVWFILSQRGFHALAAVLALAFVAVALLCADSAAGWRRQAVALGVLGLLLHAETGLTTVSEFGLLRYISPFWALLCAFYGLLAWLLLTARRGGRAPV